MTKLHPILFFMLLLAAAWPNASAAEGDRWSKNTQLLPQYCKDRAVGTQGPEWKKWRGTFGEVYIHIHHYCSGVYAEQKAKSARSQRERDIHLGKVVHQMSYVSAACNAGCVIYPDLQVRWGWALGEMGQMAAAIQHINLAIKAKPKYTSAYVKLSELYLEANQPEEARKSLEAGLQARPDSRTLKRRLKELELPENKPESSE